MSAYHFPAEKSRHEGTWLTWPHHYTYGIEYREKIEDIWLEMAYALHCGENVHIIAYNEEEKNRIIKLLEAEEIYMSKVDFVIAKSDDVWARDTGPIFVRDKDNKLIIADFSFDGWGGKTLYQHDDVIPQAIANAKKFPIVSKFDFVLEGGCVELDDSGKLCFAKALW